MKNKKIAHKLFEIEKEIKEISKIVKHETKKNIKKENEKNEVRNNDENDIVNSSPGSLSGC